MKKILVIGSKGFIGSHLSAFLVERGWDVWGADVVVDYVEKDKYFLIDATNSDFYSMFEEVEFDVCINCSGAASVPDSIEHPLRDYQLNTVNVYKLLDAIKINSPECKFVNLSSAAVYGNPTSLPVRETSDYNPLSPYGVHKMMSEEVCSEFHRFFGIQTCSLRIFSAYGEGLKKQLFWDLYHKTQKSGEVKLFGSGKESRDFIYIRDLIRAIEIVAKNAPFEADVINVANGAEVFIEDCVKSFYSNFESDVPYMFTGKARKGDPDNWVADISTLKNLGYTQKYSLEEGLRNYYQWVSKID
jgi:dTDP-glucose 4,6-dehydratase/UDP-glucose 4-epimerase